MKYKLLLVLCTTLAASLALSGMALADGRIGGHNETSEDLGLVWATATPAHSGRSGSRGVRPPTCSSARSS